MREEQKPPEETIEGAVEHVVFRNPENGFSVVRLRSGPEEITAVGNLPPVRPGETLRLRGSWTEDRRFGRQFRASECQAAVPTTRDGLLAYLGSGLVRGIGKELAGRIVDHFGADTLEVLEKHPERLREVSGIGPRRARDIRQAWSKHSGIKEAMIFLQGHGMSAALAARIQQVFGERAIQVVRENPYRLADEIFGVGFRTADRIAASLGIGADSPQRSQAAVTHLLGRFNDEGHVYVPREELVQRAEQELGLEGASAEQAIEELERAGPVVVEARAGLKAVYPRTLFHCERGTARRLAAVAGAEAAPLSRDVGRAIGWFEGLERMRLAPRQSEAVQQACTFNALVITGGPGTGKTTIVRAITAIARRQGKRVLLCAPTGRAAKRLSESAGMEAATIHRLLEFDPVNRRFSRDSARPLPADMVVVDEMSMVDLPLCFHLLEALPASCRLVMVGDSDQLPSVGPGCVLRDVVQSRVAQVVALEEIFRQAQSSRIVVNAHCILRGQLPDCRPQQQGDFFFLEREQPEQILDTLKQLVAERLPRRYDLHPLLDIQVLSPMHRGLLGVGNLNRELQALLNPLAGEGGGFRPGDKVMQLRNNYELEVFNGDIGRVEHAGPQRLVVNFDGRRVAYDPAGLYQLALAYACSIHKAQGSEYPAVVIPLHTQHYLMLQRNLLYTAVTRGRRLVVIVGSRRALELAVRNHRQQRRYSLLKERLRENLGTGEREDGSAS